MVRHKLLLIATASFAGLAALPAAAQFGSIFGGPPRPPADIPQQQSGPPGDDRYFQSSPRQQMWTRDPRVVSPPPGGYPPPPPPQYGYPQQGYPPPPGYPQQAARPPDGVQQQALPPPPGGTAATLPGLTPGQRQPRGTPQPGAQPDETPAAPIPAPQNEEVVIAPPAQKIPNNTAVFSGLDKITGRIITFDVAINETVQFGALQVTPRACYTRPATEATNTDGFIEADEITLQGEIKRVFTGWMYAASPGLHAIEHPIYDVWLTDCKGPQQPTVASAPEAVPQPPPPQQPQRPRQQQAKQKQQTAPASGQPLPPPQAAPQAQQPLPPPPGAPIQLR
jgi:hypothetical protein